MPQTSNSPYRLSRRPNRNRTAGILTISLLALTFMLLGMGTMLWIVRNQVSFGPTPTPTATVEPVSTETPNVPATIVMEDLLTQVAYTAAQATIAFQSLGSSQTATADAILASGQPQSPLGEETSVIMLPSISAGGGGEVPVDPAAGQATSVAMLPIIAAPQPESPLADASETPQPGDAGGETPTETPIPAEIPSETPTETPTFTPEPPTATATATLVTATNLTSRVVADAGAPLYQGIGSAYSVLVTKAKDDTSLRIKARNDIGEWLLVCCDNNIEYWTRYTFVRPQGNPTPAGAPSDAVGDDVRWLPVTSVTTNPQPAATPVQPAPGDEEYPQFLHDLRNSAQVPQLPNYYTVSERLSGSESAGVYLSPLVIANNTIYAVSGDRHLYAIDKNVGNQRWKFDIGDDVRQAPAVVGSNIYLATQNGSIISMLEQNQQWRQQIANSVPSTGIRAVGNKLFVGVKEGDNQKLYALDRSSGAILKTRNIGASMLMPAAAGNTLYVAGSQLLALDIDNIDTLLWQATPSNGVTTAPVFVFPGKRAIAELFFVDGNGQIHGVNAYTGEEKLLFGGAQGAKFIHITDDYIITSGEGFVRSFARLDGRQIINISIPGGLISTFSSANKLLVVLGDGQVILLDVSNGQQTALNPHPAALLAAPAVSGLNLYTPGSDNFIYIARGGQ